MFRIDLRGRFLVLAVILLAVQAMFGQSDPALGILPFSTHVGGQYDSIDPATGNIVLRIPIISKTGKTPFSFSLVGNFYKYALTYSGSTYWIGPNPIGGYQTITGVGSGGLASILAYTQTSSPCGSSSEWTYQNFVLTDDTGAAHTFNAAFQQGPCGNSTGSAIAPDGSGYTLTGNTNSAPYFAVHDRSGNNLPLGSGNSAVPGSGSPGGTLIDPDGVTMSITPSSNTYTYVDTLGQTAMTATVAHTTQGGSDTYTYTDSTGHSQTVQVNYTPYPMRTVFGCSGIQDATGVTVPFPTSIVLPNGDTFGLSYEPTLGYSGNVTGRLAKLTLPSGGYITYTYTGGNNNTGIQCTTNAWGNMATTTRTTNDGNGHTDAWKYVGSASDTYNNFTTTETDPAGNTNTYHFHQGVPTENVVTSANSGVLSTTVSCYNGTPGTQSACIAPQTTGTLYPINQTDVYTSLNGSPSSLVETKYDTYGNVKYQANYDYNQTAGAAPTGTPLQATTITYANPGNYIYDRPASVTVARAGSQSSQTTYTNYTATGHAQNVSNWTGGSSSLGKSYTYNANGTLATMTDVNGTLYTYAYNGTGGCNGVLPTSVTITGGGLPSAGLKTSTQWDCNGGVVTQTTDPNSQSTINTYSDPLWRLTSAQDPAGTTSICYGIISGQTCTPNTTQRETVLPVSGTTSAVDSLTTVDGLGRTIFVQTRQTPTSSTFDSVQYTYAWNTTGAVTTVSMPYSGTQGQAAPSGTSATTQYDALGRVQSVTNPGTGAGVITNAFNQNDVLQTLSPAPSGEKTKKKQFEYDGLGRLTSVCEITAGNSTWPGVNCAQTSPQTGYWTQYVYDNPTNSLTVTQDSKGSTTQTRSYTYDGLGRLTSETNPESGAKSYIWDTTPKAACNTATLTFNGDLVRTVDANGTNVCYSYDAIHRLTDVGNSSQSTTNPCKRFRYDNSQGVTGTMPTGVSVANTMGRLAEAETDGCSPFPPTSASIITDEWFSYDNDGRKTDAYESTPNSGGYYHPTAAYWPNGTLETLWISTLPVISYAPDGEGRISTVSANSGQNPVTATSYNAASQVKSVTFGSGDADAFTYDSNTGRMTQYKYTINGASEIGSPTWNPNGSLKSLAITDPFNSGDSQTCNYAHDDLSRIASVSCGSAWSQTFTYDPFGNVTKSGSISWQPGYNSSNNRYTLAGTSYDADGNLLGDTFHSYTWNAFGRPTAIDSITRTYDAFDRIVEQNPSGTFYQTVYGPGGGKLGVFNGSTIQQLYVPLPGGADAEYYSWGLSNYRHSDWLGSDRLESSASNHSILDDNGYAPFGEPYAQTGNGEISFTGQNKDTVWLQYDFLARQYDPKQGRWISPDPAGLDAVDPSNPQTWNRYEYAINGPLTNIDPLGLQAPMGIPGCAPGTVCPGYTMDGQSITGPEAFALLRSGAAAVACPGCTIRWDAEARRWEVLAGYETRTALTREGEPYKTRVPIWIDYVAPSLNFTSTLNLHPAPMTPQVSAVHPPDPRLKWQFANTACLNGAVNSNNQFGDANNTTPPTDSVAPVNNPTINFTSQPQGAGPYEDVKNEGTKPLQGEGPTGIAPIPPQAMVWSSYGNCMKAHGY